MDSKKLLAAVCGILLFCALGSRTSASSQLITNGGFETGDFTGWTTGVNFDTFNFVATDTVGGVSAAYEGSYYAALGPQGSDGTLSQSAATTAGKSYDFSFVLASDGGTPNDFSASFDGDPVFSATNLHGQDWTVYSYDVTATSASSTVSFSFRNDPGFLALDAVSLNPISGTGTPVPLPKSVWSGAVLLAGCGLMKLLRRRNSKLAYAVV